jgi:zinc-ribbon domain
MKSREIVVAVLVAAGVLLVGMLILGLVWGFGGMWDSRPHMGTPGMMGGFTGFGWLVFCLVPLLLGGLLIGGVVWLLSSRGGIQRDAPIISETCPNCGQVVQKNWNNCPNCGQLLRNG